MPNSFKQRHANGERAEALVVAHYESRGFRVRGRRIRSHFAEIDLVFSRGEDQINLIEPRWILCEVKFQRLERAGTSPISGSQRNRLRRAYLAFIERNGPAEFHLAFVDENGRIETIADFL